MATYASAREFIAAVIARYRALPGYADSGYVRKRQKSGDSVLPFQTASGTGGDFRFAFERPHPYWPLRHKITRFVVGRSAGLPYLSTTRHDGSASMDLAPDFGLAIACAAGISHGAAHIIGGLLFEEVGGWSLADIKRPRLRSPRIVDGVPCYRVAGYWGRHRIIVFVGIHDLLIRRIWDHRFKSEEVREQIDIASVHAPEFFKPPSVATETLARTS